MTYEIRPRPTYPGSPFTDYIVCKDGQFDGARCSARADAVFLCHVLNHVPEDVLNDARAEAVRNGEQDAKQVA